jgi:hypothetical protein
MPLSVRILSKDDYQTLERWWVEWGWIPPPRDFLPLDGLCGGMVESDGQPVVAGFMYTTNAKVAWIDWVVSDRSYRNDDRSEAINLLLAFLEKLARQTDAKYLWVHHNSPRCQCCRCFRRLNRLFHTGKQSKKATATSRACC